MTDRSGDSFMRGLVFTLRSIFTTRPALMILLLAGVLYAFYYPAAYHQEVSRQLPVMVVDLDQGPASRSIVQILMAAPSIRVVGQTQDLADARSNLQRRDIDAIVLIPADFERGVTSGTQPDAVAFYLNGAYIVRASAIGAALQEVLEAAVEKALEPSMRALGVSSLTPVRVVSRPLFNTREGYGSYVVPGVAIVIVHQTLLMGIVLLMGERRRQSLRFHSAAELLGAACAFVLVGLATALFYFGFVFWYQDYPRAGHFGAMLLVTLAFVGATVSFAIFLGSFFDRGERSAQYLAATSAVVFFLSGLPWPFQAMPAWLAMLAHLLPSTAGIQGLVKINQMGASLSEVGPELSTLGVLMLVYGALCAWRWSDRRAAKPSTD